jgi:hypothetical protein
MIKSVWKQERPGIGKAILQMNKLRELGLHNFKNFYKAIVIKTVFYSCTSQLNKQKSDTDPHKWFLTKVQKQFRRESFLCFFFSEKQ